MITMFRHASKAHSNMAEGSAFPLDSPLKEDQLPIIEKMLERYLKNNSAPDIIFCSPISRTRQTAQIFQQYLEKRGVSVLVLCDPNFGEYFGWQQRNIQEAYFEADTVNFGPVIDSDISQLHARVHHGLQGLLQKFPDKNIWIVTHRIVMWSATLFCNVENKSFSSLSCLTLLQNEVTYKVSGSSSHSGLSPHSSSSSHPGSSPHSSSSNSADPFNFTGSSNHSGSSPRSDPSNPDDNEDFLPEEIEETSWKARQEESIGQKFKRFADRRETRLEIWLLRGENWIKLTTKPSLINN